MCAFPVNAFRLPVFLRQAAADAEPEPAVRGPSRWISDASQPYLLVQQISNHVVCFLFGTAAGRVWAFVFCAAGRRRLPRGSNGKSRAGQPRPAQPEYCCCNRMVIVIHLQCGMRVFAICCGGMSVVPVGGISAAGYPTCDDFEQKIILSKR